MVVEVAAVYMEAATRAEAVVAVDMAGVMASTSAVLDTAESAGTGQPQRHGDTMAAAVAVVELAGR